MSTALQDHMRQAQGIPNGPRTEGLNILTGAISIALITIAILGATGSIPGPALGWSSAGLSALGFACNPLMGGDLSKRKVALTLGSLATIATIVVGVLGGVGMLSAQQVGWGLIGTWTSGMLLNTAVYPLTEEGKRTFGGLCSQLSHLHQS